MRTIIFLFFMVFSEILSALTLINTTNKDFVLSIPGGENLIIQKNTSVKISDEIAEKLEITLAEAVASIYKIHDLNNVNMLSVRNDSSEAFFNIQIRSSSQRLHSDLSKYQELLISYWDCNKEDDALLVILTKKHKIDSQDAINAKLNCKCDIF